MIPLDRTLADPLPRRGTVFLLEGAAMLAGALGGVYLETRVPLWLGAAAALLLALATFGRARILTVLGAARWWRAAVLGALTAGLLLELSGVPGGRLAGVAAPLALGEVGAIAATDTPWPRALAGWRPVFRLSVRLFGLIAAVAVVSAGPFVGMANGSLLAVVVGLLMLPGFLRAPGRIEIEGRSVPALRRRCPRCGVPSDWPAEGSSSCAACGLVIRVPASADEAPSDAAR